MLCIAGVSRSWFHADHAGDRLVARAQALAGQVNRRQRRRTRCVDGHRGPRSAEKVRQPPAAMLPTAPPGLPVQVVWSRSRDARYHVLVTHAPDENACLCTTNGLGGNSRILQRFTSDLEQQPLLRIHRAASRGEMAKNSASKAARSGRNAPHLVVLASAAAVSGDPSSKASHRSGGTSPIADRLSDRSFHRDSGPSTSPGKRQPSPITAIGASVAPVSRPAAATSGAWPFCYGCSQKRRQRIDGRMLPELHG